MKKFRRITSLVLALVLAFGCLSVGAFATEQTAAEVGESAAEIPNANGIMEPADLSADSTLTAFRGTDFKKHYKGSVGAAWTGYTNLGLGYNTSGAFSVANGYLTVSAPTNTDDSYILLYNQADVDLESESATANNATSEHVGTSFVLSADLKLGSIDNLSATPVFQLRSRVLANANTLLSFVYIDKNTDGTAGIRYRNPDKTYTFIENYTVSSDSFDTVAMQAVSAASQALRQIPILRSSRVKALVALQAA